MTFKMPNDNKLVDDGGRLLPQWRPAFDVVARLSGLSKSKLDRLLEIAADGDGFLGAGEGGANGDMLYRGDDGWQNLAIGDDGATLLSQDGKPKWSTFEEALPEWSLIDTKTADGSGLIQFDGIDAHRTIRFEASDIVCATGGNIEAACSIDGVNFNNGSHSQADSAGQTAGLSGWQFVPNAPIVSVDGAMLSHLTMQKLGPNARTIGYIRGSHVDGLGVLKVLNLAVKFNSTSPVKAMQFRTFGGSYVSGEIRLYAKNY